jgi:NAD(P)-dependent dehydrogenase (short-subunit alcohol dehydrogenase family)
MSVVLITGCSSGIGLETAIAFARRGDTTYASMRDPDRATRLLARAASEGATLEVLGLDVTDDASVRAAVRTVEERHGAIDVLVNNAGIDASGPVETTPIDRARAVLETNLWGAVRTARAALPAMRARGAGMIVNVTSMVARLPGSLYNGFYAASKHALGALSESLAWELSPFGIRVVCVEPGFFATEIFSTSTAGTADASSPYDADHAWFKQFFVATGQSGGDPAVVAEAVVRAAHDPTTALHTLVGDDAAAYLDVAARAGSYEGWVAAASEIIESVAGPRPVAERARPGAAPTAH